MLQLVSHHVIEIQEIGFKKFGTYLLVIVNETRAGKHLAYREQAFSIFHFRYVRVLASNNL